MATRYQPRHELRGEVLTRTGRAILHAISHHRKDFNAIRRELLPAPHYIKNGALTRELTALHRGGWIETNPLRLTHAGFEFVRGYRDA